MALYYRFPDFILFWFHFRIDEMLYFLPFSNAELRQLTVVELNKWAERAKKVRYLDDLYGRSIVTLRLMYV
jgi:hypothetical protein